MKTLSKKHILLLAAIILPPTLLFSQSVSGWEKEFISFADENGEPIRYQASSELDKPDPFEGGRGSYSTLNLFDGIPSTAWVEGVAGHGIGESVIFSTGTLIPSSLTIRNGYQKSESIYRSNSRVKEVKLTLCAGFMMEGDVTEIAEVFYIKPVSAPLTLAIKDIQDPQVLSLPWASVGTSLSPYSMEKELREHLSEDIRERKKWCPDCPDRFIFSLFIRMEIVSVWPGSRWDDTCISELMVSKGGSRVMLISPGESIVRIYSPDIPGSEGSILVDTDKRRGLVLADRSRVPIFSSLDEDESLELVLMDVSDDLEWAQVDYLIYSGEGGRAEEYSVLYHTRSLSRVSRRILDDIYGASGFVTEEGKIYLETIDGRIDLKELAKEVYSRKE